MELHVVNRITIIFLNIRIYSTAFEYSNTFEYASTYNVEYGSNTRANFLEYRRVISRVQESNFSSTSMKFFEHFFVRPYLHLN